MIFERTDQHPGARLLLVMACIVVVVYGLKFAASILLPSALALFLAILSVPLMVNLQKRGVPRPVAIGITVSVTMVLFGLLVLLATQSFSELQQQLPRYANRLQILQEQWIRSLDAATEFDLGAYITPALTTNLLDPGSVVDFLGTTVGRIAQFVSTTFIVFLILIFMLDEASVFPDKLRYIMGTGPDEYRMAKVAGEIQSYLGIKTAISLTTGLLLGLWAFLMDLDFPVLLGVVAFLLNYIPTVGSIIAAVPAILLSIVLHGTLGHAMLVTVGYVAVNTVFGNILEPNLMGRRLGMSTLVVILSLLFWGWTWGPVGALLSVPLTVVLKIWLEHTPDLAWAAVLLDKTAPADATARAGPADVDLDEGV